MSSATTTVLSGGFCLSKPIDILLFSVWSLVECGFRGVLLFESVLVCDVRNVLCNVRE